jgi:hypothetical protein
MNAPILATETLRIANQNSGHDLFEWLIISARVTHYEKVTVCGLLRTTISGDGILVSPSIFGS